MKKVIPPPLAIGQTYGPITIEVSNDGSVLPIVGDTFRVVSADTNIAVSSTIGTVSGTLQFNVTAVAVGSTVLTVLDSAGSKQAEVDVTVDQIINLGTVGAAVTGP